MSCDLELRCSVVFYTRVVVEGLVARMEVFWTKFRGACTLREDAGVQGLVVYVNGLKVVGRAPRRLQESAEWVHG